MYYTILPLEVTKMEIVDLNLWHFPSSLIFSSLIDVFELSEWALVTKIGNIKVLKKYNIHYISICFDC